MAEPRASSSAPPAITFAPSTALAANEPLLAMDALIAWEGTAADFDGLKRLSLEQTQTALLSSPTLAFSKPWKDEPGSSNERDAGGADANTHYFMVAREAMFVVTGEAPLPQRVSILLLYGTFYPPCFGSAARRVTLSGDHASGLGEALVVDDCPRPPNLYGALAIRGAKPASVSVLVEPEQLAAMRTRLPENLENLNEILKNKGSKLRYSTDRHLASRDDPKLSQSIAAAEQIPELRGAHAAYVLDRADGRYIVLNLDDPNTGRATTSIVRIDPNGARVTQTLSR